MIKDINVTKTAGHAVHVKCANGPCGWVNFRQRRPYIGSDANIQEQPFMMTEADSLIINELTKKWGETTIYKLIPV